MPKKRAADTAAKLSAVLWGALGYLAKKRSDNTLLDAGQETKIDVTITGKIGRKAICERVAGKLSLGQDSQRASQKSAPPAHVAALLLAALPDDRTRATVMEAIVTDKERTSRLPPVTTEQLDQADQFLKRLRSSTITRTGGSLVFQLAAA